ncbi:hypothetical protein K7432_011985 [Basidiobolus ranarum]|uniref:Uncharacterized protein n=1 Tax=Basidiobolus ranarum TaxID=34480 RepID=A0ABR2VSZ6_9FUNG
MISKSSLFWLLIISLVSVQWFPLSDAAFTITPKEAVADYKLKYQKLNTILASKMSELNKLSAKLFITAPEPEGLAKLKDIDKTIREHEGKWYAAEENVTKLNPIDKELGETIETDRESYTALKAKFTSQYNPMLRAYSKVGLKKIAEYQIELEHYHHLLVKHQRTVLRLTHQLKEKVIRKGGEQKNTIELLNKMYNEIIAQKAHIWSELAKDSVKILKNLPDKDGLGKEILDDQSKYQRNFLLFQAQFDSVYNALYLLDGKDAVYS